MRQPATDPDFHSHWQNHLIGIRHLSNRHLGDPEQKPAKSHYTFQKVPVDQGLMTISDSNPHMLDKNFRELLAKHLHAIHSVLIHPPAPGNSDQGQLHSNIFSKIVSKMSQLY